MVYDGFMGKSHIPLSLGHEYFNRSRQKKKRFSFTSAGLKSLWDAQPGMRVTDDLEIMEDNWTLRVDYENTYVGLNKLLNSPAI